jgi:hypothetical protein
MQRGLDFASPFVIFWSIMKMNLKEKRRVLNQKLTFKNVSQVLRSWLTMNTRTKIWIFIFTIFLWLVVILNNYYSYSFSAKIEARNIELTKTLTEELPSHIQARFSGKGFDLLYLLLSSKKSFRFILDCYSIKWYYDFPVNDYFRDNPDQVIVPRGINVTLEHIVWPETVHVELDVLQTKKVPVKPDVELSLAPGYIFVDPLIIMPDSVILSGPRTFVRQFSEMPTEKLVLENISGSVTQEIALEFTSKNNIQLDKKRVRIQQKVDQLGERELTNIPLTVLNLGRGQKAEIIPSTATLTVTGAIENLKTIQPEDIKIVFDIAKIWRSDEYYYTPTIDLPSGLSSWEKLTPETFEIRIIRER